MYWLRHFELEPIKLQVAKKYIWGYTDRFLSTSCFIAFLLLYFGGFRISPGIMKIRESKKQFFIVSSKIHGGKRKTFVQIYYFLIPRLGRTPCNGKGKKRGTMWTGMMSSSRDDQALSKPELSVTISWEMPGTGAISAHHLVSIPMNGMHCLD